MTTIRVALPGHLRTLAGIDGDVVVEVSDQPTIADVLDALESRYPVLRGTIREHVTLRRRAFMRYFACEEDLSHEPPDTPVPGPVVAGQGVFRVVGAIAGG
ncbi:MAG TPA: MoaD/ThiS family protein [Egibacteraceae bacterium]|nr:MoaD/ThiS family protein [Egibacteraceae bacterium]